MEQVDKSFSTTIYKENSCFIFMKAMKKEELQGQLMNAHRLGKLIIPKHDPYRLGELLIPERSVISYDITDDPFKFIDSGIDRVFEYRNPLYPNSPRYLEIVPKFEYSTATSGVTSFSAIATSALDRVVAVYGYEKGLHIFGEHSRNISRKYNQQALLNKRELK